MPTIIVEDLEAEVLQLPTEIRARLIERLIASLDVDPEIEEAWATEVERRNLEIEKNTISLLSGAETLAKLKAEFQ
jgi:Putative addiction module component